MELHRFLSLLAACIGFVGAIFLSKGVLSLSPKAMLELTPPHARIAYAPEQIASLASQKADTLTGVLCILIAFSVQVISLLFFTGSGVFIRSRWITFWVALAIVSLLTIVFSLAGLKVRNWYRIEMGKLEIRWHYAERFQDNTFDVGAVRGAIAMAKDLLDLQKEEDELISEFLKRVFNYVGCPVPNHIDLKKFDSGKVEKK